MLSKKKLVAQARKCMEITQTTLRTARQITDEPSTQFTGVLNAAAYQAAVLERIGLTMNRERFLECAGDLFDGAKRSLGAAINLAPEAPSPAADAAAE